jgi:hypothetical protein
MVAVFAPQRYAELVESVGGLLLPRAYSARYLDVSIVCAAIFVHLTLSIAYATILEWLIGFASQGRALAIGALFGLVLYFVNFYVIAETILRFEELRSWVIALGHVLYGVVVATIYVAFREHSMWFAAQRP